MSFPRGVRRRDGNSSEAVAALLNPHEGYREKLKKRGITPKDFERENKLRLKQMQRQNREQRAREEAARREAFKLTRFKGVRPRVFSHEEGGEEQKHAFLRRGGARTSHRHEAWASSEAHKSPLPPAFSRPAPKAAPPPPKEPVPSLDELEKRSRELVAKMSLKEKRDFVNANAWEVIRKSPAKPSPPVVHSTDKQQRLIGYNRNFGRIPKYLLERKEQWAKEEEARRLNAPDPDCPPGMTRLDEDERLRTLQVLRQSLDEARLQLNHLPLRVETQRQIRRKNELEAKLQEIEDAIKVFDRSKVYVALPLAKSSSTRGSEKDASFHERSGAAA
ncbi:hypothetical protein PybrP1_008795 [[Pythium] brassicae (nom. inval.)]|nr:hypothetical protein PybrP1_008795 [[Pythium] brassicae (nom. inval.)]